MAGTLTRTLRPHIKAAPRPLNGSWRSSMVENLIWKAELDFCQARLGHAKIWTIYLVYRYYEHTAAFKNNNAQYHD
jgi:hypothetical protein